MSFMDIFKNKFLEMMNLSDLSWLSVLQTLGASLLVGIFIFFIYKACYRGVMYSHNFNITLALMTMLTSMIILTISSNVVLSLGMVGALSIVRYRTAIKDPMDLMFLFWAVADGIAIGAKCYSVYIAGTLVIGLAFFIFTRFKTRKMVYLLVINYEESAFPEIQSVLSRINYTVRSKLTKKNNTELTLEVHLRDPNTYFVNLLSDIENVNNVALVSYNGDFAQ